MSTTKKSTEQVPFLERPIVRTILPIAGFVIICVLFAILTDGRLFQPKNISLLLSQSYMLLISSIGVFMVMTMGGLDFSQGSMLGVASIVVCYLSLFLYAFDKNQPFSAAKQAVRQNCCGQAFL